MSAPPSHPAPLGEEAKRRGAYYTPQEVAQFLCRWALRTATAEALDPSFGGGIFLEAAAQRLLQLGGAPHQQVWGVELDPHAHAAVLERWTQGDNPLLSPNKLWPVDFFSLSPQTLEVDAVVGNPPYIRYQRFTGAMRARARMCAQAQGVELSGLASAWAPFVVHAVSMMRAGARLALVIPQELLQAQYARPVLRYLSAQFERVLLLTFTRRLFPQLSEETLLLLGDTRRTSSSASPTENLFRLELTEPSELTQLDERQLSKAQPLALAGLLSGQARALSAWLPEDTQRLYQQLSRHTHVQQLGEVAEVQLGYVSGHNAFFHLDEATRQQHELPLAVLAPAVLRGRALRGLRLTPADWQQGLNEGSTGWLLRLSTDWQQQLTHQEIQAVERYLSEGARQGVPLGYKCRMRSPWYRVPSVQAPDALLTYMSGDAPRLVLNAPLVEGKAGVVPNTIHAVQLRRVLPLNPALLVMSWWSSLTRLSVELEGHALGGGMLKLELREARAVRLALPPSAHFSPGLFSPALFSPALFSPALPSDPACSSPALLELVEQYVREGQLTQAQALADHVLLEKGLGLEPATVAVLAAGAQLLRQRRLGMAKG
ncbi:MAG: N-6 DNA methylase [Myxococcota bacterium]